MRTFVLGMLFVMGAAAAEAADGVLGLSWNQCSPVISGISGSGNAAIYVSVLGIDQPHYAYEIWIAYGNPAQSVPDAWRFDAAGCQGSSRITMDPVAPALIAETCPTFQPGSLPPVRQVAFVPPGDPSGFPPENLAIKFQIAYPTSVGVPSDPAIRYFLGRFQFDHSLSVPGTAAPGSCGGFDQSMCFKLMRAGFIAPNEGGIEHFWRVPGAPGMFPILTFNSSEACAVATPVIPSTWGRVRQQFR